MPYEVKVNKSAFLSSLRKVELSLVRYAARVAVGEVKRQMYESPATGRWYPSRRPDGGWHQASAPGEAPAPDTKELVNSIAADVSETDTGAESVVGSNAYGAPIWRYLEFGTSRMLPRPSARMGFIVAVEAVRTRLAQGQKIDATFGPEVR